MRRDASFHSNFKLIVVYHGKITLGWVDQASYLKQLLPQNYIGVYHRGYILPMFVHCPAMSYLPKGDNTQGLVAIRYLI